MRPPKAPIGQCFHHLHICSSNEVLHWWTWLNSGDTGSFTAPYDGTYTFHVHVLRCQNSGALFVHLMKNQDMVSSATNQDVRFETTSCTAILGMMLSPFNASDHKWIHGDNSDQNWVRVTVSGCDCDRALYMATRRATTRPSPGSDLGREEFYRFAFLKLGMGLLDPKSNLHFSKHQTE